MSLRTTFTFRRELSFIRRLEKARQEVFRYPDDKWNRLQAVHVFHVWWKRRLRTILGCTYPYLHLLEDDMYLMK